MLNCANSFVRLICITSVVYMVTGSWNSNIDILVYHLLLPDYSFPTACIRNTVTAFFWGSYVPVQSDAWPNSTAGKQTTEEN